MSHNPFKDAIESLVVGAAPFDLSGVYHSVELTDDQFCQLQNWASEHRKVDFATGLSMIDCADLIVKSAIENGNILPKERPKRYQRSRKRGDKLPKGVVCITRPGQWGNPYETAEEFDRILGLLISVSRVDLILKRFASHSKDIRHMAWIAQNLHQLSGKDVACFCPLDKVCHGDSLLKYANGG